MAEESDSRVERRKKGSGDRRNEADRRDAERLALEEPRRQKIDRRRD